VPIGAPEETATERAEQVLGVARPCHRGGENPRPQDRTSREGSLQRAGCAMGKGESLVKGGRRKAGHKSLGQKRHCRTIQLEARSPQHLTVGLQTPGVPLREANQQDVESVLQVGQEGRHEHVKTGRAAGLKVLCALQH